MTTGLSGSMMYIRNELNVFPPCDPNCTLYCFGVSLSMSTVAVSNDGSVSGWGFFSNRNLTLVGVAAEAVKVI